MEINKGLPAFFVQEEGAVLVIVYEEILYLDSRNNGMVYQENVTSWHGNQSLTLYGLPQTTGRPFS